MTDVPMTECEDCEQAYPGSCLYHEGYRDGMATGRREALDEAQERIRVERGDLTSGDYVAGLMRAEVTVRALASEVGTDDCHA